MSGDILIVDDEADIRELVAGILDDEGYTTRLAGNADEALQAIEKRRPNLVFLDIWMQGSRLDGMQLLDVVRSSYPDLPVVMISGHGTIDTAVNAIKTGAFDFIEKPFKSDRLLHVAMRALETTALKREISELRQTSGVEYTLVGSSQEMNTLRAQIDRLAPTNSRVMIMGASGSGKELVARAIHDKSRRSNGPFVVLNAANISPETMELELFGTEAEPGTPRKVGALEEAHGGTLYLDEVSEMPRDTQSKIMRVLVDQTFTRVGGSTRVQVDVRVLSSSSVPLEPLIETDAFRSDLYHRLAVVPLPVPSLAERRSDIPELVQHFMQQLSKASGLPTRQIADDAMTILQTHDWPGNVRQLRNNVERLMILARGENGSHVTADLLPPDVSSLLPKTASMGSEHLMGMPLRDARELFERDYLSSQINRFNGNISKTAEFIGMERSALHRKLKSLGLNG
ncbi:sigma-54 dependent transcriptional regulator [Ahrensia marina]|uniref:nitrogen assimilation response regulator NtrX n=1 Tax=Ahrensia marina TaxID=1514904 RepID=UPI0035D0320A